MIRLPARSLAVAAATTATALLPASLLLPAGAAHAQAFPAKPVRFIVPFAAGSATDSVARLVGAFVTESTGQSVLVENRAGASGMIGAEAAARAPADGYTLLIGTNTTNAANASLFKVLPYNQQKDFAPVSLIGTAGLIAAVHPSLPVKSIAELTALAKRNPGKLNFGEGSASSRASVEMYKEMAGIDFLRVPYKSNPQAVTDLVSGQVVLMIADMVTLLPQVKAGKLRPLAVSTSRRLAILPDLPTMSEAGVKGYDAIWVERHDLGKCRVVWKNMCLDSTLCHRARRRSLDAQVDSYNSELLLSERWNCVLLRR